VPRSVIIHIGTPKTGTTSIQDMLALASAGNCSFAYPLDKGANNHVKLLLHYLPYNELPLHIQLLHPVDNAAFRQMKNNYRQKVLEALGRTDKAILSAEGMSAYFTEEAAANLRSDLEAMGYNKFAVALYVRDPADCYLSTVQQTLRLQYRKSFLTPSTYTYRARSIAELWEGVFPGCLEVRKFPPDVHGDVTIDFRDVVLKHLGITLPPAGIRSNESHPAESMKVLQEYRILGDSMPVVRPDHQKLDNHLQALNSGIAQSKPILKKEVAHHIRARHQEDFRFLRSRYHIQFDWLDDTLTTSERHEDLFRIEELLERCDGETVIRLLLSILRSELSRPQPVSILSRVSRKISTSVRRQSE
jgi:hypothetical protein